MKIKKKVVATFGIAAILGTSLLTGATGANNEVKGVYKNMRIVNNGAVLNLPADQQSVIINGWTYLPVRAMGEALGQEVTWGGTADPNSVYVSGGTGGLSVEEHNKRLMELNEAKQKVAAKEAEIKTLNEKIKKLEEENKKTGGSVNNTDLENRIIKNLSDNNSYNRVRFDIKIKERTSRSVDANVKIDRADNSEWIRLSTGKKQELAKDIVDEIRRDYRDYTVNGYFDADRDSIEFYGDSRGNVELGRGGSSGYYGDFRDLEDDIMRVDRRNISEVKIKESSNRKDLEVDVDLSYRDLTSTEKSDLRDDIEDKVKNSYEYREGRYEKVYVTLY